MARIILLPANADSNRPVFVDRAPVERETLEAKHNALKELGLWEILEDSVSVLEGLLEAIESGMTAVQIDGLLRLTLEGMRLRAYQFRDAVHAHVGPVSVLLTDEHAALGRVVGVEIGEPARAQADLL